jgi:hypothetical protein
MGETEGINSWTDKSWECGCGALNAGWLERCGRCDKLKDLD